MMDHTMRRRRRRPSTTAVFAVLMTAAASPGCTTGLAAADPNGTASDGEEAGQRRRRELRRRTEATVNRWKDPSIMEKIRPRDIVLDESDRTGMTGYLVGANGLLEPYDDSDYREASESIAYDLGSTDFGTLSRNLRAGAKNNATAKNTALETRGDAFVYQESDPEEFDEDNAEGLSFSEGVIGDEQSSHHGPEARGLKGGGDRTKEGTTDIRSSFPPKGTFVGNTQSFGALVTGADRVQAQLSNHPSSRSQWYRLDEVSTGVWEKTFTGFSTFEGTTGKYRIRAKNAAKNRAITNWIEFEMPPPVNESRDSPPTMPTPRLTGPPTPRPTLRPTPVPTNLPTPPPTSPDPTPRPTISRGKVITHPPPPNPTPPPSPNPTPPPSPNPTPPPSPNPTPPPSLNPTLPPSPNPTHQSSPNLTPRPSHNPTPRPTPDSTPYPIFSQRAPPAPSTPLLNTVQDRNWDHGGVVKTSTGRIIFFMNDNPYICSGTVVDDGGASDRTLILTAAHCAYDETKGRFAESALFIPDQDSTRGKLTDTLCHNDPLGCWAPAFAVVDKNWAEIRFPGNVPWDYAFYVVENDEAAHDEGYLNNIPKALGDAAEPLPVSFNWIGKPIQSSPRFNFFTHAFGYSANKDPNFRYCAESMSSKFGLESYENLWLDNCGLSVGASGGPWMLDTDTNGRGTVVSLNSWGYSGTLGMAGPNLSTQSGSKAECLYQAAKSLNFDDVVGSGVVVQWCG